jgi:Co/Zn/Cd efflux system component
MQFYLNFLRYSSNFRICTSFNNLIYCPPNFIKQSGKVLLDANMDDPIVSEIIEVIENSKVNAIITDLHVSHVGKGKYSCILCLDVEEDIASDYLKKELQIHEELVHITIELNKTI